MWFEDEGDALKRLQVHRWWQGLSNAMRYVEKQTIEGEEIDKFFFEIAKDVAKKWHFSRRMALLLEKLTAHKKGDLSVIVSAFSQLKDNECFSILILTLEYFIGYSRLDWMEWIKVALTEGDNEGQAYALRLLLEKSLDDEIATESSARSVLEVTATWVTKEDDLNRSINVWLALLPKFLLAREISSLDAEEYGKVEALEPFFDLGKAGGLSKHSKAASILLSARLSETSAEYEGKFILNWIAGRWPLNNTARKQVEGLLARGNEDASSQVFTLCVILIEAIGCFVGAKASKRAARVSAANTFLDGISQQIPKKNRRQLYFAATELEDMFKRFLAADVERHLAATAIMIRFLAKFH